MSLQQKRAHIVRLIETAKTLRKMGDLVASEATFADAKRLHAEIRGL